MSFWIHVQDLVLCVIVVLKSNAKFQTFTALIALVISAELMKISSRGSGWVFWR
jgi:hypothetical protein